MILKGFTHSQRVDLLMGLLYIVFTFMTTNNVVQYFIQLFFFFTFYFGMQWVTNKWLDKYFQRRKEKMDREVAKLIENFNMHAYPKFGPKAEGHHSVGRQCPVCKELFKVGEYTTLEALPPDSEDEYKKMVAGEPYNAPAVEVHWDCRGKYHP